MPDRKACDQILRLYPQYLLRVHGKDKEDRLPADLVDDGVRIAECQLEQPDPPRAFRLIELVAIPERVADSGSLGVEPDIPGERDVAHFGQRLDGDIDRQQVADPTFDHARDGNETLPAGGHVERSVEQIAALPIRRGV